jgi:hypothetical protein
MVTSQWMPWQTYTANNSSSNSSNQSCKQGKYNRHKHLHRCSPRLLRPHRTSNPLFNPNNCKHPVVPHGLRNAKQASVIHIYRPPLGKRRLRYRRHSSTSCHQHNKSPRDTLHRTCRLRIRMRTRLRHRYTMGRRWVTACNRRHPRRSNSHSHRSNSYSSNSNRDSRRRNTALPARILRIITLSHTRRTRSHLSSSDSSISRTNIRSKSHTDLAGTTGRSVPVR